MNISLPEEITQAMTAGVARGVEQKGFLQNLGPIDRYQQVAAADAMVAAAGNPGGSAMGDFMQAGMGMAMAGQMAGALQGAMAPGAAAQAPAAGAGGPPPLPGQVLFHVDMGNGQSGGPYNLQQVQAGIANGQVGPNTLVWAPGMAAWSAAGTVPALQPLFATPPPMPGAGGPPPVPPTAPPAQ
jgi:membrane protease subunit (stomatin/prohibitin family)